MACILISVLLGIAAAARQMRKNARWLYRHLNEYETTVEEIEVKRVVFNDITGKAVKKNCNNDS